MLLLLRTVINLQSNNVISPRKISLSKRYFILLVGSSSEEQSQVAKWIVSPLDLKNLVQCLFNNFLCECVCAIFLNLVKMIFFFYGTFGALSLVSVSETGTCKFRYFWKAIQNTMKRPTKKREFHTLLKGTRNYAGGLDRPRFKIWSRSLGRRRIFHRSYKMTY